MEYEAAEPYDGDRMQDVKQGYAQPSPYDKRQYVTQAEMDAVRRVRQAQNAMDAQVFADKVRKSRQDAERWNRFAVSMIDARKSNPDDEARISELADRLGTTPEMVRANRSSAEHDYMMMQLQKAHDGSPAVARFMSDPENARVAHDDVENLSAMDMVLRTAEGIVRAVPAGVFGGLTKVPAGTVSAYARNAAVASEMEQMSMDPASYAVSADAYGKNLDGIEKTIGDSAVVKASDAVYDWSSGAQEAIMGDRYKALPTPLRGLVSGTQSLGEMAGGFALSVMTGSPAPALAFGGLSEGTSAYMSDIKEGRGIGVASAHGLANAAVEVGTELLGIPFLGKTPIGKFIEEGAKGVPFWKRALKGYLREIPGESLATQGQLAGDVVAENMGGDLSMTGEQYVKAMSSFLEKAPDAAVETLFAVAPMSLGFSGMASVRRSRSSKRMREVMQEIQDKGNGSKLKGRSLEVFKKVSRMMVEGTPLENAQIDAQDFTTYFQSQDVDPANAAAGFGVGNYDEAMATGGKILMPYEVWVGEFSENGHAEALLDTTTLNENIPSIKDAALHQERVKRILENNGKLLDVLNETARESEQAAAAREAVDRITSVYQKHLEASGMTPETALTQAKVAAAFHVMPVVRHVESLAKEQGREVTRDEIARAVADRLNRYDLRIDRTSGMQVRTPRNLLPRLDSMLAALRAGSMPSASAVYGQTLTQAVMARGGLLPTDDLRLRVKEGRLPKRLLRKGGLGADVLASDSGLAGYMSGLDTQSMQADDALVEALEAEYSRGEMTYDAGNLNSDLLAQAVMLGSLADDLGRAGIDLNVVTDDAEVRRLLQAFNGDRYGEQGEDSGAVSEAETVGSYEQRGFTVSDRPTEEELAEANRQYDAVVARYKDSPLWMKAPNGQPTMLTERQWVQVRTPNFKKWFGDWEKAGIRERLENQEPVAVEKRYEIEDDRERRNIAASLIEKQFNVEKSFGVVSVSKTSMRKSFGHGSSNEKLDVVPYIKELLEKAEFIDSRKDFDGKDIKNYYLASKITHGNETKLVFFRVRERSPGSRQLYVHDVYLEDDIKQKAETRQTSGGTNNNAMNARGSSLYKSILQDIYAVDKDSVSKVVDENGEPLVVYHGTKSDFDAFNGKFSNSNTQSGVSEDMFVFSDSPDVASTYAGQWSSFGFDTPENEAKWRALLEASDAALKTKGRRKVTDEQIKESARLMREADEFNKKHSVLKTRKWSAGGNVMPVFLNIRNPFDYDANGKSWQKIVEKGYEITTNQIAELARQHKHDGTIIRNVIDVADEAVEKEATSIFVYSPSQIKSATANAGTFDAEDPSILYQSAQSDGRLASLESQYNDAIQSNDMDAALRIVREYAALKGYGVDLYRDRHEAPRAVIKKGDFTDLDALRDLADESESVNVFALANGVSLVPDGFFSSRGARMYGYDTAEGMESFLSIRSAMDSIRRQMDEYGVVRDMPKVDVYRAVPKGVVEGRLRSGGEWVSPSRRYAKVHGDHRFGKGGYRIIKETVSAENLWWDGNDINEWGFDDGESYSYRNTKNNRKLLDAVTYDAKGKPVPLSKRFNEDRSQVFYQSRGRQVLPVPVNPVDGVRQALASGGIHAIAGVSDEAVDEAGKHGLDISGYVHAIDGYAIRHIKGGHSNEKVEASRGQVALTDADFLAIPDVIANPDHVVYGLRSRLGRDLIGYLKKMPDGTTLYLEEVRNSREVLATQSMRKFSPTIHATSILKSLRPTSETDRGSNYGFSIEDNPEPRNLRHGNFFNQNAGHKRGAFHIGPNRTFRIELMAKADFSTFVHESSHFQLEMLADMVSEPDASGYIKQEWQVICDYLGGDIRTLSGQARIDAHERFARSFEAYLMEGKAPSVELRTVFRRFKDWLVHIYRTVRNLDVRLSDDIRRVFDRMLASDAQIEQAAVESGIRDSLVTAQNLGLSEDETRALKRLYDRELAEADDRLRKRLMRSEVRKSQKQYMDELKRAQKQAEKEYEDSNLVYVGRLLTDQGDRTLALNEAELVKAYGRDYLSKLPKFDGKNIYAKDGETFLDELAEANGFGSSDELLQALENMPPKKQWVAQRAQEIVDTFFGDTVNAAEISDAVDEAMNNDPKGERLKAELVLLRKAVKAVEIGRNGQRADDREASRQARREADEIRKDVAAQYDAMASVAKQVAADKLVKDLKPHMYLNAAHKAMRGAIAALNKAYPDYAEAARLKQQEVFNFLLYRAARDARKRIDSGMRKMRDIAKRTPKDVSKNRVMQYVYKAQFIARSLLGRDTEQVVDRLQTEISRGKSDPFDYDVGSLREISVQDALQSISDAEAFWDSSMRENRILAMGRLVDIEAAGGELSDALSAFGKSGRKHNRRDTLRDGFQRAVGNFMTSMTRMESWCDMVDGGRVGDRIGAWMRYVFNPMKEAAQNARAEQTAYLKDLADVLSGFNFTRQTVKVDALDGFVFGEDTGYAKMEIAHAFLHCGNRSNFERLIVGHGWGGYVLDSAGNRVGIDDSKWQAAVKELTDKGIWTKDDMDRVQMIWDLMARLTPKLQEAYKAVNGRYFDEIRAEPFEMFGETYSGGYVPAIYDPYQSKVGQKQEVKPEDILNTSGSFMAKLSDGFGVTRVQGVPGRLVLDLSKIGSHFNQQVLFANMAPAAADVGRLLRSRGVQDALMAYDPMFFQDVIVPWFSRAVTQNVYNGMPKKDAEERFLQKVRSRAGIATMFMNVVNAVEGFFDLTAAYSKVKAFHLHDAFGRMVTDRKATLERIFEMSPYMRERLRNESNKAMNRLDQALHPDRLKKVDNWINDHAYFLQEMVDGFTAPVVFLGAYNQAVEGGLSQAEAVAQADSVVRSVYGTMMPEDLANREVGSVWKRLFTQFTGYFVQRANTIASERSKIRRDGMARQRAAVAMLYIQTVFLPAWIGAALRKASAGSDDENWSFGQWLMDVFGFGTASYVVGLGGVTLVGQAAGAGIEMMHGNKMAAGRVFSSPATQLVGNIVNYRKWFDSDGSFNVGNSLRNLAGFANICPVVPVVPNRPVASLRYLYDVGTGDISPTGVWDFTRGAVTGRASKDSR